jgi:hypothetical protein
MPAPVMIISFSKTGGMRAVRKDVKAKLPVFNLLYDDTGGGIAVGITAFGAC